MNEHILRLARENAPCFIYSRDVLARQAGLLRDTFPGFDFLFSVKANPFPPVMRALAALGIGADAASAREVLLAEECGMAAADIYFSAAGKSDSALREAWDHGHLIADSIGEAVRIGRIAAEKGEARPIGVRIDPCFNMDGGPGTSGKFGICEEDLPQLRTALEGLPVTVCGIHVHLRSQNLDAAVLTRYYENCFALALRVQEVLGCTVEYINFGGGVGIAYNEASQQPLDYAALRQCAQRIAEENRRALGARLLIESGRFLTCQAGTYFMPVVDKKTSGGVTYVIVENCLNGFQKPAIAAMLRRAVGPDAVIAPQEPLFTREDACTVTSLGDPARTETVHLVGNLCCALDVLQEGFTGPALEIGDLVAVSNAGAYACTLSVQRFSSHHPPAELLVDGDGNVL